MYFIEHSTIMKTNKEDEYILINLLNGLSDIVSEEDLNLIKLWRKSENIQFDNKYETELYDALIQRKYIMENSEEENRYKESQLAILRKNYEKRKNNIKDLGIVLTYDCNFGCSYCFESNVSSHDKDLLTEDMIDRTEELFPNIESILLYGGEPLLEQNMDIIKYIIEKYPDKEYRIITNGYGIDKYIDILKKIKVKWLQVTLDGGKETHDKSRFLKDNRMGTFDKLISNIDLAIKNNIRIKIRMNISRANYQECLELRDNLKEKYPNNKLLIFELQPIFQLDDESKNFLEPILYSVDEYSDNTINNSSVNFQKSIIDGKPIGLKFYSCSAETSARLIDNRGDIYSCLVSVGNKDSRVGTYYPEFKYFEKSLINRNITTIEQCKGCKFALLCGGGCGNSKNINNEGFIGECSFFSRKLLQYSKALGYETIEEVIL
ncbi:radical SAM/SPASM domain-containing protein [uncultured Tissierella sp.]|uniref:radical SAM/SPASM domain-containing protein n=1 Tax=uncultured Tissierella sp. TaxID=448160 RepID=UPI00280577B5|nr:radical SAM protein [uncultured Tissierella sp.]MDU5080431.1 radical SAM protein [Bacillota bacterium]